MMNWPAIELSVGLIVIGAAVNWISMTVFFWWKKRQQHPEDLEWRIERIEDAFIAHTGITLNGKSYKKGH